MKRFNGKTLIIFTILSLYLITTVLLKSSISNIYTYIINPIVWLTIGVISILLFSENKRFKASKDKLQYIIICTLSYVIIYYLSGLIFTFGRNVYSLEIVSVIKNIWAFVTIIIFKEIVRSKLAINLGKNKVLYYILAVLMSLSDLYLFNLGSIFQNSEAAFKYTFQTIFPIITTNALCTYLATVTDCVGAIIYRCTLMLARLLVPIQPNLDWFMAGMLEGLFPAVIYFVVNYFHLKKTSVESKRRVKKNHPISRIFVVLFLVAFGFFVGGFFSVQPVAVMSGSMQPIFNRGDVVLVQKINKENINKLEMYDIIEYRIDKKVVLHRIVEIHNDGDSVYFITKGDNNDSNDTRPVYPDQIDGKIQFKIKYVGFPSVLLYDYFNK